MFAVAAVAAIGLADDLWSGAERGFRGHLGSGRTTGVLKRVGIPLVGLAASRKLSGALLVDRRRTSSTSSARGQGAR